MNGKTAPSVQPEGEEGEEWVGGVSASLRDSMESKHVSLRFS